MNLQSATACLFLAFSFNPLLASETKLTCPEVEATEVKWQEYDKENAACDVLVQEGIKAKVDAAKHNYDECKKKHSIQHVLKCGKELKASTTAVNTPKQVAGRPIMKELAAKPDTACAKAEAIGKANTACTGPKKVLEAMKRNCIKV
jgi:hypothetical protein